MNSVIPPAVRKPTDIRKACNNCIRAKAACDNNRPCFRCVSHKIADSCANVARKHNVAKRKRFGENGLENDDPHFNGGLHAPHNLEQYNLSYMLNNSLNAIINNLNNNNGTNNYYQTMPHAEGEVNGHSVVNNVINSAIQNLNSRSTSAIISNTISNLNNCNPTYQGATNTAPYENNPPAPKSQEMGMSIPTPYHLSNISTSHMSFLS